MQITGWVAVASLLAASGQVCADAQDVFSLQVSASYNRDNNLFRLDKTLNLPQGINQRSDSILGLTAGIRLDKPFKQQRIKLNAAATRNRYSNNDFLDHTAYRYDGSWDWYLTPRVSGQLSTERNEALNKFDDYRSYTGKSLRTNNASRLSLDYWFASNWHALLGMTNEARKNSQTFRQEDDYDQNGWYVGARYDTGNGRNLGVRLLRQNGDYSDRILDPVNLLDNGYEQSELEFSLSYPFRGKTQINATLGYLDRQHHHYAARDYSGWQAKADVNWKVTGKIGLKAGATRRISDWQDADSSYAVTQAIDFGPTWAITAKQTLAVRYERSRRQHKGALAGSAGPQREDGIDVWVLDWNWRPSLSGSIGLQLRHETRDTTLTDLDYTATVLNANVHWLF